MFLDNGGTSLSEGTKSREESHGGEGGRRGGGGYSSLHTRLLPSPLIRNRVPRFGNSQLDSALGARADQSEVKHPFHPFRLLNPTEWLYAYSVRLDVTHCLGETFNLILLSIVQSGLCIDSECWGCATPVRINLGIYLHELRRPEPHAS